MTLAITIIVISVITIIIGAWCGFSSLRAFRTSEGIPYRFFFGWVLDFIGGIGLIVGLIMLGFFLWGMYGS